VLTCHDSLYSSPKCCIGRCQTRNEADHLTTNCKNNDKYKLRQCCCTWHRHCCGLSHLSHPEGRRRCSLLLCNLTLLYMYLGAQEKSSTSGVAKHRRLSSDIDKLPSNLDDIFGPAPPREVIPDGYDIDVDALFI
jgi:hypothetical protein